MTFINIGALNCRGLSEEVKRRDFFLRYRKKYDIILLTDTHCTKEKENQWLHEWGYKAIFSSHTGRSRGVAVLFNNTFPYQIHQVKKDTEGNYIVLDLTIQDYRMTLVVLYGPNEDRPLFFQNLKNLISDIPNSSIIMAGDWNVVQDFNLDTVNYKSKNNIKSNEQILEMKNSLDLVDIWRSLNPETKRFTWRGPNKKQSRLDYFLISTDFEPFVKKADIDVSYRSDHSPVYLSLQFYNQSKGKGTWKFNNSLLSDKNYIQEIKNCIKETINQYSLPGTDVEDEVSLNPHLFWEVLKCMIRGKTISYTSFQKKKYNETEIKLEKKLEILNRSFDNNPSDTLKLEINDTENELTQIREKKVTGIMARAKARWEAEGEKCTNYFCNLEKRNFREKLIPKLIRDNGEEILDQFDILNEQKSFYEKLYTSTNPTISQEHKDLFLNSSNPYINTLSEDQMLQAEGKLSKNECLNALKNMKNCKSPGLDGFTVEFYKFFWKDLNEYLVRSFNYSLENESFSISQRQGLITCIPKEGKSKFLLKNWRPITLLNVDTKIASAALANRIKPLLQHIISETQQGFIRGRYIGECTRLIYDIIEKTEEDNIPGLLLLLDFEKAFDTLEWSFIDATLKFFGFGPTFCKWVSTLYLRAAYRTMGIALNFSILIEGLGKGIRYPLTSLYYLWNS